MEEEIENIQLDMDEKVQIVESQIEEILKTIREGIKKELFSDLDDTISEWRNKYACIVVGTKTGKSKKES